MKHFIHTLENGATVDALLQDKHQETAYLNVDRPAVIICPGGGYQYCSAREADPVALKFAAAGFHTFVLRYSVGDAVPFPTSLIDLARTIKWVRDNAAEFGVIKHNIAVCGFSAGGHLAASLGVHYRNETLLATVGATPDELRPNLLILGYPVISTSWMENAGRYGILAPNEQDETLYQMLNLHTCVTADTPPSFIFHGVADAGVPVRDSLLFASALEAQNVPFELHLYSHAPHGFSVADDTCYARGEGNTATASWVGLCIAWLERNFYQGELGRPVNKATYSSKL